MSDILSPAQHSLSQHEIDALEWRKHFSDESDIMVYRDEVVNEIVERANDLIKNGKVEEWYKNVDKLTRAVSGKFNGPLAEELAKSTNYVDKACIQMFRDGAHVSGALPQSGLLEKVPEKGEALPIESLLTNAAFKNCDMLSKLKPEKHGEHLLKEILSDVEKGRMTKPQEVEGMDLRDIVLSKRFGLEQGTKSDGSAKIRAVDDCTGSNLNSNVTKTERMICDGVDKAILIAQWFDANGQHDLAMGKVDIKSAYRRVPIKVEHRKLSWIAFKIDMKTYVSRHNALCFGSTGSVYGWNRVGMFLTHIILHVLKLPSGRWVDDIFWVETKALVSIYIVLKILLINNSPFSRQNMH